MPKSQDTEKASPARLEKDTRAETDEGYEEEEDDSSL